MKTLDQVIADLPLERQEKIKAQAEKATAEVNVIIDRMAWGFDWYQNTSKQYAMYDKLLNVVYPVIGLAGETGEVCEKIKKILRDNAGKVSDQQRKDLAKELGDVLWYVAAIARDLGVSLGDVAIANIEKLESRAQRNVIQGSGDNR